MMSRLADLTQRSQTAMISVRASQVFTNEIDDAVAAKKQLDAGTPFAEVVEKYSTCPSKQNGGDLGWMPEDSAGALMGDLSEISQGALLGPLHTPYGYHIIKITEVKVEESDEPVVFNPDTSMVEVNKVLPEVHTLLFKTFHIGMPVSGYKPDETIFTVCEKHDKKIGEVLSLLNREAGGKLLPVITPEELKLQIESGRTDLVLLDIREKWEHDIAKIEGATLITRDNSERIITTTPKDREVVLIDWKSDRAPSFQKWLGERGFTNVKCLEGGIDAWSEKVNTHLARYDIDSEDDDYRYEDIFDAPQ
jgi:rhodanese-related sulfurtransferase